MLAVCSNCTFFTHQGKCSFALGKCYCLLQFLDVWLGDAQLLFIYDALHLFIDDCLVCIRQEVTIFVVAFFNGQRFLFVVGYWKENLSNKAWKPATVFCIQDSNLFFRCFGTNVWTSFLLSLSDGTSLNSSANFWNNATGCIITESRVTQQKCESKAKHSCRLPVWLGYRLVFHGLWRLLPRASLACIFPCPCREHVLGFLGQCRRHHSASIFVYTCTEASDSDICIFCNTRFLSWRH